MAILGIDHVIVIGRDLDALAGQYRALGFTVTPGGRHAPSGRGVIEVRRATGDVHAARKPVLVPEDPELLSDAGSCYRSGGPGGAVWEMSVGRPSSCRMKAGVPAEASGSS